MHYIKPCTCSAWCVLQVSLRIFVFLVRTGGRGQSIEGRLLKNVQCCFLSLCTVAKSGMSEHPILHLVERFRLLENIQGHWKDIGTLMGIETSMLEKFEHKWRGDLKEQCREVLQAWLEQGSEKYPVTWRGLLDVLEDVQLKTISLELQEKLGK